jgi:hypothetical protein
MPKAHVKNGRLLLDEPTELPDGSEVDLVAVGSTADDLDDEDRKRLLQALDDAEEDVRQGRLVPADEVIAELRRR